MQSWKTFPILLLLAALGGCCTSGPSPVPETAPEPPSSAESAEPRFGRFTVQPGDIIDLPEGVSLKIYGLLYPHEWPEAAISLVGSRKSPSSRGEGTVYYIDVDAFRDRLGTSASYSGLRVSLGAVRCDSIAMQV
jgi:hypothetical protein